MSWELVGLALLAAGLTVLAVYIALQVVQRSPDKREKKRRQTLHLRGRLGDAFVTEANETTIFYGYSVQGVQYTASQDVSSLRDHLPADPERLIGVANIKYAINNPANSMLLCEEWSGLRTPARAASGS
jgi:hypothetical protein